MTEKTRGKKEKEEVTGVTTGNREKQGRTSGNRDNKEEQQGATRQPNE